jgi:hypothetical protein
MLDTNHEYFLGLATAKAILNGKTDLLFLYPKGPVYPALLSIFINFVEGPMAIFYFNSFLIVSSMFFLYFLLKNSLKNEILPFFGVLLVLFLVIQYNPKIEPTTIGLWFFITLFLVLSYVSIKLNETGVYILTLLSIIFAAETRYETISLFFLYMGFLILMEHPKRLLKSGYLKKILPAILIFILLSPVFFIRVYDHWFKVGDPTTVLEKPYTYIPLLDIVRNILLFPLRLLNNSSSDLNFFVITFLYFWASFPLIVVTILTLFSTLSIRNNMTKLLLSLFIIQTLSFLIYGNGYQDRYALTTIVPLVFLSIFGLNEIVIRTKKIFFFKENNITFFLIVVFLIVFSMITEAPIRELTKGSAPEFKNDFAHISELFENVNLTNNSSIMTTGPPPLEYQIEYATLVDTVNFERLHLGSIHQSLSYKSVDINLMVYEGMFGNISGIKERIETSKTMAFQKMLINETLRGLLYNATLKSENFYVEKTGCGSECQATYEYVKRLYSFEFLSESDGFRLFRVFPINT